MDTQTDRQSRTDCKRRGEIYEACTVVSMYAARQHQRTYCRKVPFVMRVPPIHSCRASCVASSASVPHGRPHLACSQDRWFVLPEYSFLPCTWVALSTFRHRLATSR